MKGRIGGGWSFVFSLMLPTLLYPSLHKGGEFMSYRILALLYINRK
jgi:hypothetical protein